MLPAGCLLRSGCLLPLALMLTPFVLVVVALLLVFRGSPGGCGGGREITVDPALAFAYDQRWLEFNTTLTTGLPASLVVSEDEATSRTREFLDASSAPVEDVRVCFVDGRGDINGTLTTPFGPDVAVRIKGNATLGGRHPEADIDSIQIGGLPSFVTRPFHGLVSRIVDNEMERIELDYRLGVEVRDGDVLIEGTP